ncbi:MAG: metal-dependent transcriptional regulator [Terriglobia bacterium]
MLLQAVWRAQEERGASELAAETLPAFRENRATFLLMAQEGSVNVEHGLISLTPVGQKRADELIRCHRLAERFFYETFGMDEDRLHENALRIEPLWTGDVVTKICTFLNHPRSCPHGDPIPRGECCPAA